MPAASALSDYCLTQSKPRRGLGRTYFLRDASGEYLQRVPGVYVFSGGSDLGFYYLQKKAIQGALISFCQEIY